MGRAGGRGGGGGSRGGSFGGSRGGSFGGGRSSSSFSSSRSSSSFGRSSTSFGSSSSGRSYSSSSRSRQSGCSYSGGIFGTPRTTGPIIINNSGNNNQRRYTTTNNSQPTYSSNNNRNTNVNRQSSTGCIHIVLIIVMIMSLIMVLFNSVLLVGAGRQQRTKLNANINITSYYTDELNWINDPSDLERGLKYFYEKTGVQPHVYITDDVGGDFYDCVEDFANDKYDEMFADEAHVLLIFWEQDYYSTYCLSGSSADAVIDSEARNIILDKLDEYYWDSSLDEDEYFSKAFSEAADEIMKKPASGFGAVAIPLIIFIAALVVEIILKNKEKQAKKDAELKEMLNKPLETFGSTEAENLAKKYANSENENQKSPADKTNVSTETEDKSELNVLCIKCGHKTEPGSIYCSNCGEKLT